MTSGPIDTIREALEHPELWKGSDMALAALTEVEHQLAAAVTERDRFDDEAERHGLRAAEWKVAHDEQQARAVAAERRANDLADTLRQIADSKQATGNSTTPDDKLVWGPTFGEAAAAFARAALDRQEQR